MCAEKKEDKTPVLKCPICGVEILPTNPFKPFCSQRHKEVDLNRWFTGFYRVETDEIPDPDALSSSKQDD